MILTCPTCQTRYLVDDTAVDEATGRQVRCASCGHSWHHRTIMPAADERGAAAAIATTEAAVAILAVDALRAEPPHLEAPASPAISADSTPRRSVNWGAIGGAAVIVLLAGAVLVSVFARREIAAMWPPAARLYGFVGLGAEPLGVGLEIRKVIPTRTGDGLVVEGEVANVDGTARSVPRLRVALLDPHNKEIQVKIVDVPKDRLLPGEITHFRAPFEQAGEAASKVAVTFASG